MISLKAFVTAIYDAVSMASESLAARNHELFSKYFTQVEDNSAGDDAPVLGVEKQLSPKMVRLEYPGVDPASDGTNTGVMVPLITLAPFSACQIEKVTLTTEFKISVDENEELHLDFSKSSRWGMKPHVCKLEVVVSQADIPDGLKQIIEGYENVLRRQL